MRSECSKFEMPPHYTYSRLCAYSQVNSVWRENLIRIDHIKIWYETPSTWHRRKLMTEKKKSCHEINCSVWEKIIARKNWKKISSETSMEFSQTKNSRDTCIVVVFDLQKKKKWRQPRDLWMFQHEVAQKYAFSKIFWQRNSLHWFCQIGSNLLSLDWLPFGLTNGDKFVGLGASPVNVAKEIDKTG